MRDFLEFIIMPILIISVVITIISTPLMYFNGLAKSEYLQQTEGVTIPWYRACWLDIQINSAHGKFEIK